MDSSQGFLGLRCVTISRCQNGFGFTLRHFIVYPPEILYSEDGDSDEHGLTNGLPKVTEPVDTIFVRDIRDNSPAAHAGLCVGDRIVSVNGETIVGKSYDQVVSMIQQTRGLLCLEVSPKQYDTLQRFYEEQAYHPETNQRPYEPLKTNSASLSEPLYHYPFQSSVYSSNHIPLQLNDYAFPPNRSYDATDYPRLDNMSSGHSSSHSPAQFFSHLPRPVPYKSTSVWANPSERNGDKSYVSSSVSQSDKSVQQQQQQQLHQQKPHPQGYYPFNHSFDKSTVWKVKERDEPNSGAKSADSILGGDTGPDGVVYRSPLRSESMECLSELNTNSDMTWKKAGPGFRYSISSTTKAVAGPSQTQLQPQSSDFRDTMVVTMSSTNSGQTNRHPRHEPLPSSLENSFTGYENQIVDRIRRSCEQKEEFLRRPNQPIWTHHQPHHFPKELYAQPQKFTKLPWPPANMMPSVTSLRQPLQSSVIEGRSRNDKSAKSHNVTVISVQHSGTDSLSSGSSCRPDSNNANDAWSPVDRQSKVAEAGNDGQHRMSSETDGSKRDAYSSQNLLSMYELPKNRTTVVGSRKLHCDPPLDWRPDLATLTGYQHPQLSSNIPRAEQRKETLFPSESNETETEVQNNTENVILRSKGLEPESENERLVRRVSYLKATSSPIDMERKSTSPTSPVKSFEVMSCKTTYPSGGTGRRRSMANKLSAEFLPKGRIHKLKQFFEDRTQPTTSLFKFYVDSPTSEYPTTGAPKSNKPVDLSDIVHDGKVHFKIRIGESKRGTYNRSWRQGFAQVRLSGYLYLSKECLPKEAVTGSEEAVIISVSIRDGVLIEQAEDYTKRKFVLRIRTSFIPDQESHFPFSTVTADNFPHHTSTLNSAGPNLSVELLIQAEDSTDLNRWLACLQKQLENNNYNSESITNTLNKGVFFGSEFYPKGSKRFLTSLLPSPGTPGQTSFPSDRPTAANSSAAANSSNTLSPNTAGGGASTAVSPKVKTWKGKVAKQWKKVHDIIDTSTSTDNKSSSTYASLPTAGATFGINLENCPPGENNPYIPRVIEYSIELVERKGIEMVGLYRIPGNNASVAILTECLNRGEDPNPQKDLRWMDVHVVASLIKSFLRRLPDPLLTNERYPVFIQAADGDESSCLAKLKELIKGLPIHNYETLKAVTLHLKHVADKGEVNRMDARNLAIVFGPTIVRTAGENFSSMVADMKNQCKIVEALILHAEDLFNVPVAKPPPVVLRKLPEVGPQTEGVQQNDSVKATGVSPIPSPATIEDELKASLITAAKRKVSAKENQPLFDDQNILSHESKDSYKPVDEKGFIRSYAGLNEVTERRIRNFELETRAMLYRDDRSPNSSSNIINVGTTKPIKGIEDIKQQQIKLDDALRKAKDDLETEDIFDQIADNPSILVHHRDRNLGLCASSPGPFTLSNSSLSSSNSNSTAPSSLLTSSLPAWPTGNRLGPAPFRNSMPPQSLPPKPPVANTSLNTSFETVPPLSPKSQTSMRRVSSFDRLQGSQSQPSDGDGGSSESPVKFDKVAISHKDSFRRLRRPDGTFGSGMTNPKQLGGSLDSLKDITAEAAIMGKTRMRTRIGVEGSREDLSPKSDGSDMVATLTKTLDKKLQSLRTQFSPYEPDMSNEYHSHNPGIEVNPPSFSPLVTRENEEEVDTKEPEEISEVPVNHVHENHNSSTQTTIPTGPNHFKKGGRRRHSLIERRKSSYDAPARENSTKEQCHSDCNNIHENNSDVPNGPKASSKKLAKECRRRHSLSGASDILSLVFRGSEKLTVHRDSDGKKNRTLSNEAIMSALKNASILESHV